MFKNDSDLLSAGLLATAVLSHANLWYCATPYAYFHLWYVFAISSFFLTGLVCAVAMYLRISSGADYAGATANSVMLLVALSAVCTRVVLSASVLTHMLWFVLTAYVACLLLMAFVGSHVLADMAVEHATQELEEKLREKQRREQLARGHIDTLVALSIVRSAAPRQAPATAPRKKPKEKKQSGQVLPTVATANDKCDDDVSRRMSKVRLPQKPVQ